MATDIAACRAKLARTNEYLADFSASSEAWVEAEGSSQSRSPAPSRPMALLPQTVRPT